jgi:metal-responsive CopG/Arc/MetJ family transcriptional regulator
MKVKTSVTLSEELLRALSEEVEPRNRSAFIEEASWSYLRTQRRAERDRMELAAIDAHADALNREAREVLEYQDDA